MALQQGQVLITEGFRGGQLVEFAFCGRHPLVSKGFELLGIHIHLGKEQFVVVLLRLSKGEDGLLFHFVQEVEGSFVDNEPFGMTYLLFGVDTEIGVEVVLVEVEPDEDQVESRNEEEDIADHVEELLVGVANSLDSKYHDYQEHSFGQEPVDSLRHEEVVVLVETQGFFLELTHILQLGVIQRRVGAEGLAIPDLGTENLHVLVDLLGQHVHLVGILGQSVLDVQVVLDLGDSVEEVEHAESYTE